MNASPDGPPPQAEERNGVRARRFDPQRKERIVDAALVVIAEGGLAGTSLRKIAVQADVPLGSLTYHFSDMQELLRSVFRKFVAGQLSRMEDRLCRMSDPNQACREIRAMIDEDASAPAGSLALMYDFQALVLRDAGCLQLAREWIEGRTRILSCYFDPEMADAVGALMQGLAFRRCIMAKATPDVFSDAWSPDSPNSSASMAPDHPILKELGSSPQAKDGA